MKTLNEIVIMKHTFEGIKKELVKLGNDCFIGRCGSFHSVFGENGKVTKITDKYIYCTSESGSVVKYDVHKNNTVGKWRKNFYFININCTRNYNDENVVKNRPSIWNDKKLCLEYK